jgi:hypothetical protein
MPDEYARIKKNPESQTGQQVAYPNPGPGNTGQTVAHRNASRRASMTWTA